MSTPAGLPMVPEIYVSMVAGVCATCKNWAPPGVDCDTTVRVCQAIIFDGSDDLRTTAAALYADGGNPALYTRENFGCRLWAGKEVYKGKK